MNIPAADLRSIRGKPGPCSENLPCMTRKNKPRSAQANKYEKIFKENIEAVVPSLIANLLETV